MPKGYGDARQIAAPGHGEAAVPDRARTDRGSTRGDRETAHAVVLRMGVRIVEQLAGVPLARMQTRYSHGST
jgi:hypothetical protein